MTGRDEDAARIESCAPVGVGLLIIDMINDFEFEGGEALRGKAETLADVVLNLRDAADRLGVPVIYVNAQFRPVAFGALEDRCGVPSVGEAR